MSYVLEICGCAIQLTIMSHNGRNGNPNQAATPLTVEAMMEALIQATQIRRENDKNHLSEFLKLSPPAFHGTTDPMKAES